MLGMLGIPVIRMLAAMLAATAQPPPWRAQREKTLLWHHRHTNLVQVEADMEESSYLHCNLPCDFAMKISALQYVRFRNRLTGVVGIAATAVPH